MQNKIRVLLAALLAGFISATVLVGLPGGQGEQAHAYSFGPGIHINPEESIGSYQHTSGALVYCVEMPIVIDEQASATPLQEMPTLEAVNQPLRFTVHTGQSFNPPITAPELRGDTLKQLNWIVKQRGQTGDNQQAAAVQLALWKLREPGSSKSYQDMLAYKISAAETVSPGVTAQMQTILAQAAAQLQSEADQLAKAAADEELKITVTDGYTGTVEVPAGTVELQITNGLLEFAGKQQQIVHFEGGTKSATVLRFSGVPPQANGFQRHYRVSFSGKKQTRVSVTASSVMTSKIGSSQRIAGPHLRRHTDTVVVDGKLKASFIDMDTLWSPVLTTTVPSEFVEMGGSFSDTVSFSVATGSNPWRWYQSEKGERVYAPITAVGTLYGPFLSDPALNPAAKPPAGAPVAATATVVTDQAKGPGSYQVTTTETSREAGYYSWVWQIKKSDQAESLDSLPADYSYSDGFGTVKETQITPSRLAINTKLSNTEITIGESLTDAVSATVAAGSGGWLQGADGKRIPAVLRGTLYQITTTDGAAPTRSAAVPTAAKQLGETVTVTVNGPDEPVISEPVLIPLNTTGYVTMVWCLHAGDQPEEVRGRIQEGCDDFAVPSETAKVNRPAVVTKAQESATYRDAIHDIAAVTGPLPPQQRRLTFTAYLQPAAGTPKYDASWAQVSGEAGGPVIWQQRELVDPAALCEAQPVAVTAPVEVTEPGDYRSPDVTANSYGTVYWVETLEVKDPVSDEFVAVHRGECGLPNETTVITPPTVQTQAVPTAFVGDQILDVASVSGKLSDDPSVKYELTFEAYAPPSSELKYQTVDGREEIVPSNSYCTSETRVFEQKRPVRVTKPGDYYSDYFGVGDEHVGPVFWVETLWIREGDGEAKQLHRGKCGIKNETTIVSPVAKLATTGSAGSLSLIVLSSLLGVTALTLLLIGGRRTVKNAARERR